MKFEATIESSGLSQPILVTHGKGSGHNSRATHDGKSYSFEARNLGEAVNKALAAIVGQEPGRS